MRSPTPGPALFVNAWVKDQSGKPVADAEVDVWQSSPEGYYENQDPIQADMNLRGKFTTDKDGHFWFRSVKPAGYPIPVDGPVGELVRAQGRHNMRPGASAFPDLQAGLQDPHLAGLCRTTTSNLETDVQFGVTKTLVGNYVRHDNEPAPDAGREGAVVFARLHVHASKPGEAKLPRPPISGKARGERPQIERLERV